MRPVGGGAAVGLAALAARAALGTGLGLLGAAGCAVPPWSMGAPLNGKPSIPATTEAPSIPSLRALAVAQRAAGHTALELRALHSIARADRLRSNERERLVTLLEQRARELLALGRPVPACADLRDLEELAPAVARALAAIHAAAERDAGDVWLAVGDHLRAREAYQRAAALGATAIEFRLAAAAETPPAYLALAAAERAVLDLPLRAVPPFAELYLAAGGGARARAGGARGGGKGQEEIRRATLERAARAARQEKQRALAARIAALIAGDSVDDATGADRAAAPRAEPASPVSATGGGAASSAADQPAAERLADALLDTPAATTPPQPPVDSAALDDWVVGGASVSARLVPLLERAAHPMGTAAADAGAAAGAGLLAPGPRSRRWAELLLDEDPTSPDVLELTAIIDARAGRIGGAERKLVDLVYFTPDRYLGLVRTAGIWERVGQGRLGCVAWLRAARWRDEIDDPAWGRALACLRRDPGAGDWRSVLAYVLDRTPPERRSAAAATLDPAEVPLGAPAVVPPVIPSVLPSVLPPAPVNARPAGAPIPCDTGGSPR